MFKSNIEKEWNIHVEKAFAIWYVSVILISLSTGMVQISDFFAPSNYFFIFGLTLDHKFILQQ